MRRLWRRILIGLAILVGLATAFMIGAYIWVSNPAHERLALPKDLVSLESPEGKTLLEQSNARVDHEKLEAYFQTQEKRSWCGVASAVTVLNSLPQASPLTQASFFNDCVAHERTSLRTTFGGMTIDSLARMMQCYGVEARVFHAETSSLDEFRRLVSENLRTKGNFVVVNYDRARVGQSPMGHISPISAYHEASDRLLVLDVASFKYPPTWVATAALWDAMNTIDQESKRTRGYVLIAPSAPAP